jgi:hypothetical protein
MKTNQFKSRTRRRPAPRVPWRAQLAVEFLESRVVLSQFNAIASGTSLLKSPVVHHGPGTEGAGITPISSPDAVYQSSTTKLLITVPDFSTVASLSDGTETATFSVPGTARTVPGGGWASWSSPPDSESATPRVIFDPGSTELITLSAPAQTFGVELEPNLFTPSFTMTATFRDAGGNILGTISRDVLGQGGARLFAGTVNPGFAPIASVQINIDPSAQGFAFAQVRYALSTVAPSGPYVVSSTPSGTVQELSKITVTFNQAVDPGTVTPDNVSLTDPSGNPIFIDPNTGISTSDDQTYSIAFDPQTAVGTYTLVVGPNVLDFDGNCMDQDRDGDGLCDDGDAYTATFTVSNELVVNGGFETGSFAPWRQSGDTSFTGVGTGSADGVFIHSGMHSAFFGPVGSLGFITQTLSTTPGATYTLDFWLSNPFGGSPTEWQVSVGGSILMDVTNPPPFLMTEFNFTFTASSSSTDLQFGFLQVPDYFYLDDVSVTPSALTAGGGRHVLDAAAAPLGASLTTPAVAPVTSPVVSVISPAPVATPAAAPTPTAADQLFAAADHHSSSTALTGAWDDPVLVDALARHDLL